MSGLWLVVTLVIASAIGLLWGPWPMVLFCVVVIIGQTFA